MPDAPQDSSSVATTIARYSDSPPGGEAAEVVGDREAEAAELAQARDDLLGDVGVRAVHVLGVGSHALGGEAVEGGGHHGELLVEVAVAGRLGQGGENRGVALGRDEGGERRVPVGVERPELLAAEDLAGQVAQGQAR